MFDAKEFGSLAFLLIAPCLFMITGGVLVQFILPGTKFSSAVQHFAAGVVFGAISLELVPIITDEKITLLSSKIAIGFGFLVGVVCMILVGRVLPRLFGGHLGEEEEEDDIEDEDDEAEEEINFDGIEQGIKIAIDKATENTSLLPPKPKLHPHHGIIPWGLTIPVAFDAFLDGILVGLGFVAGAHTGFVLSMAISIENCFLGMTVSVAFAARGIPRWKAIAVCSAIPFFIPIGGVAGAFVLSSLDREGPYFIAIMSFGLAALMYLVSDELLVKAHENKEDDWWYVTLQFFVGFSLILLMVIH